MHCICQITNGRRISKLQSLASQVRKQLHASRKKKEPVEGFNFSTTTMLTKYLEVWNHMFSCILFVTFDCSLCNLDEEHAQHRVCLQDGNIVMLVHL